ncbi:MAG TPA: YebC/PmpR family DNA-binding transcriptional regulator [Chlamydiales bacterium]|jgi:YebC/PmpR family DNA-binding regulatory protein|nr:YebC/PmpR family DNA-binding transcriptional regulator [Chlamydiales bacterium]
MAGHSKWANMKHRKERSDKKKGKIFSRITKEIMSAVKQGGADPKANSKLRLAIQKAKDANMPNDNVERNIKKATSEDQQDFSEMTYELYGYGGVGILVDIMTDNKNRISGEIRIATNKHGGTIATPGAVSYNFDRKGLFRIPKTACSEEELFLLISEAGAEDLALEEESYIVYTSVEAFIPVKEALEKKGIKGEEAELAMIPKTLIEVDDETANSNIALIEYLESLDDVDAVYHNMKI